MRSLFFRLTVLILFLSLSYSLQGQIKGFSKVKWHKEKISPGLVWKSSHTLLEDTIIQNINLLIVNTRKRNISLQYNPKQNIPTSRQALAADAIAAVNAGFFSIKDGGSVTYIRSGGKISDSDTSKKWTRVPNMNGSLLISEEKEVFIDKAKTNGWYDSHSEYPEVLVTGPLLLSEGKKARLPETSLVITAHPRTAVGLRNSHKVILVTLDGRTDQARGMSLIKLTDLMLSLRCKDALNLDGGGSTTMWIKGKPFNGVVNMPCDNKKFDHEGERAVSDILIIR